MTERDGRECVSRMCEYILSFCTFVHERDGGVRIYRRKRERERGIQNRSEGYSFWVCMTNRESKRERE